MNSGPKEGIILSSSYLFEECRVEVSSLDRNISQ